VPSRKAPQHLCQGEQGCGGPGPSQPQHGPSQKSRATDIQGQQSPRPVSQHWEVDCRISKCELWMLLAMVSTAWTIPREQPTFRASSCWGCIRCAASGSNPNAQHWEVDCRISQRERARVLLRDYGPMRGVNSKTHKDEHWHSIKCVGTISQQYGSRMLTHRKIQSWCQVHERRNQTTCRSCLVSDGNFRTKKRAPQMVKRSGL